MEARAHLLARPRGSPFGSSAEARLLGGPARGARLVVRGREVRWPRAAGPGVEVLLRGRFRRPRRPRGGGFDYGAHLRARGVAGEMEATSVVATGLRRGGAAGTVDRMRVRAERAIASGLPPGDAALARGMVLGQDEAIERVVVEDWRAAGLGHLLAVSGQNVMLLGALALPFLAVLGLGPRGRALALLSLIAIYVPLAGAGPSLQRAGVMGAAGIVALAASRPASRWYALLLAAVVTLALNPRAVGEAGWQLSFAAVVGILVLAPPLRRALGGLPRPLAEGAAITVAATLATAPLLAHHFGSLPLVGLPANLLALPAVAPVMWLGMLATAVGQLAALGPPAAEAGSALASLCGMAARLPLGYLGWIAQRAAEVPGGQLALPLTGTAAVVAGYAALAAVAWGAGRAAARAEPRARGWAASWRREPRTRRTAALGLCAALVALAAWRLWAPPAPPDRLTVSFLDIGQGDATLIQSPEGGAVLFDGGPPEARVARLLRAAGVRRLSLVVATHVSRDHQGGLQEVVERYRVDTLLHNGDGTPDRGFRRMVATARESGARVIEPRPGQVLRAGGLTIRIYGPRPRPPGPPPEDPNPRAIVAVVSHGDFDLFLSGDAESDALAQYALPSVDAMKVPHHGSADPGLPQLLRRLRPSVAAIEVGENTYGHPTGSTLAALRAAVPNVYRTDRDGTVRLRVTTRGMRVATER